jgi:phosphoglycerol transferase
MSLVKRTLPLDDVGARAWLRRFGTANKSHIRVLLILVALVSAFFVTRQAGEHLAEPIEISASEKAGCAHGSGAASDALICDGASALQLATFSIHLLPGQLYRIDITGQGLRTNTATLVVDFFAGPTYDNPQQEGVLLLPASRRSTASLVLPSGSPPKDATIRVANYWKDSYQIDSIQVTRIPALTHSVKRLLLLLIACTFLYSLWAERLALSRRFRLYLAHWDQICAERTWWVLALTLTVIALLLIWRNSGMDGPIVFADEMTYSLLSASGGNASVYSKNALIVSLPNQLFFDIYGSVARAGGAMLSQARVINALFFCLAGIPLFAIARRWIPAARAIPLVAVLLLLPNNTYTAYFMPESLYFLMFCMTAWAFLGFLYPSAKAISAVATGIALALLTLVKPHGFTILLACALTLLILLVSWRGERQRILAGFVLMLVAFTATRIFWGVFLTPGEGPLFDRLLGLYANILQSTAKTSTDPEALKNLILATRGNLGSLLLLFGFPLIIGTMRRSSSTATAPNEIALRHFQLFVYLTLACLLIGTIKFTATMAGLGAFERADRIHERYYDFLFAIVVISGYAAAYVWRRGPLERAALPAAFWSVSLIVAALYLWLDLPRLQASLIDHPVLLAVQQTSFSSVALGALLFAAICAAFTHRLGHRLYALALLIIGTFGFSYMGTLQAGSQSVENSVAIALKGILEPGEIDQGFIVGENGSIWPFRVTYYLQSKSTLTLADPSIPIDPSAMVPNPKWVLTLGDYHVRDWVRSASLREGIAVWRAPAADTPNTAAGAAADSVQDASRPDSIFAPCQIGTAACD